MAERRSRAEQQAANREALVVAACGLIRSHGFGVGVEEIARAAGLTKGAVYSNFDDRSELILAAAERLLPTGGGLLLQGGSLAESLSRDGLELAARVEGDAEGLRFSVEILMQALRDPRLHERALAIGGAYDDAGTSDFVAELDRAGWAPPVPPQQLLVALNSLGAGLALHRLFYGPEVVPDELFAWAYGRLAGEDSGPTAAAPGRTDLH